MSRELYNLLNIGHCNLQEKTNNYGAGKSKFLKKPEGMKETKMVEENEGRITPG